MKVSIKVKKFWYSDIAADGGMGTDLKEVQLGQREATVQFNGSDADTSNYKNVVGQILASAKTKGDKTMNFQLADLTPEVVAAFTGGTASVSADALSFDAPENENVTIEKSIMFLSDSNVVYRMPRVAVDAYPIVNDDDLHYFQVNGTVLTPEKAGVNSFGYDVLLLPDANDIVSFSMAEESAPATITVGTHTVAITVVALTDPSVLVASIGVSPGASITPNSGEEIDYTNPVAFTVESANGTSQVWTVTVTVTP